jgi:hypothetical protein
MGSEKAAACGATPARSTPRRGSAWKPTWLGSLCTISEAIAVALGEPLRMTE